MACLTDQFGRSIILPAMVETYAVVAFLIGILAINWLASMTFAT